ncbi:MAG: hypothetical protein K2Q01_09730, partial [Rickettsiales bacterium]|nr:hypothetical protein [Rickettsiales bacterium]
APISKDTGTPEKAAAKDAPLQSGNALQISSAVLSLLQQKTNPLSALFTTDDNSTKTADLLTTLLGDSSGPDLTTSLLGGNTSGGGLLSTLGGNQQQNFQDALSDTLQSASLEASPLESSINSALQATANSNTKSNPVQALLGQLYSASNAYNKTLLQNAQAVLDAGEASSLVA